MELSSVVAVRFNARIADADDRPHAEAWVGDSQRDAARHAGVGLGGCGDSTSSEEWVLLRLQEPLGMPDATAFGRSTPSQGDGCRSNCGRHYGGKRTFVGLAKRSRPFVEERCLRPLEEHARIMTCPIA